MTTTPQAQPSYKGHRYNEDGPFPSDLAAQLRSTLAQVRLRKVKRVKVNPTTTAALSSVLARREVDRLIQTVQPTESEK